MTIIQSSIFDFAALDSETRVVVQQEDKEFDQNIGTVGASYVRACHNLTRIHAALRYQHPGFVDYCRSKPGLSNGTAYKMIDVAKKFPESGNILIESREALHILASAPADAREEALTRALQGEAITYSRAREIVEEEQDARRYDGFTAIPAPIGDDNDPLSDYEEQVAAQYVPAVEYIPSPPPSRAQQFAVMVSSETNEWYTPANIIALAREVLGDIDLDPASCAAADLTVRAKDYYDQERNGLAQPWGGRIWLNPPYGKTRGRSNQDVWAEKLIAEYTEGTTTAAVMLVKAAFGYAWFMRLWHTYPICILDERLYFTPEDGEEDGQAKAATAILYFGPNVARFKQVFRPLGRVILPED